METTESEATTLTGLRLRNSLHKDLQGICDINHLSISKVLGKFIELFLNDDVLQERVIREATLR